MPQHTPAQQPPEPSESLLSQALAIAQEPQWARLLVILLVSYTNDRDLERVLGVVRSAQARDALTLSADLNDLGAALAERPQFFDPNRPGE